MQIVHSMTYSLVNTLHRRRKEQHGGFVYGCVKNRHVEHKDWCFEVDGFV